MKPSKKKPAIVKRSKSDPIPGIRNPKPTTRADDSDTTDADVLDDINIREDGSFRFPFIADCDLYPH